MRAKSLKNFVLEKEEIYSNEPIEKTNFETYIAIWRKNYDK
jgi:hypothetical protein